MVVSFVFLVSILFWTFRFQTSLFSAFLEQKLNKNELWSFAAFAEALPHFRLVDVPGLGFARVSHELRERWIALIGGGGDGNGKVLKAFGVISV